jgi:outer membrane immunogenic protein
LPQQARDLPPIFHLRSCRRRPALRRRIPPVSPVYNWGGVYFGFNLGYGFGTSKWTDPHEPPGSTGNFNLRGFVVGPTVGVNFQTDSFVFGAEVDFDGSWIDGKNSSQFCPNPCETKSFWNSTLRARLGYAADRILFYGTGGGAAGNISAGISGGSLQSVTRFGWTAGAGLEAAFTHNLTARVEYLFVGLQNGVCNVGSQCGFPAPGVPSNDTVKFSTSMIARRSFELDENIRGLHRNPRFGYSIMRLKEARPRSV